MFLVATFIDDLDLDAVYGPFDTWKEASEWADQLPLYVQTSIRTLIDPALTPYLPSLPLRVTHPCDVLGCDTGSVVDHQEHSVLP